MSRWLAVTFPVEYYEFVRGLQWSVPYFNLPWETGHSHLVMVGSSPVVGSHSYISKIYHSDTFQSLQTEESSILTTSVYGLPLAPMEYRLYFEVINTFILMTSIILI